VIVGSESFIDAISLKLREILN